MPKVNDIEMYYEVHGEGTPLVLIQGYGGSSTDWIPEIIQGFEDEFKVIIFDNRGTGQSDKPDVEYSIKMMADDVTCLMESIGIQRAHVLGLSMGGVIAQEMANLLRLLDRDGPDQDGPADTAAEFHVVD